MSSYNTSPPPHSSQQTWIEQAQPATPSSTHPSSSILAASQSQQSPARRVSGAQSYSRQHRPSFSSSSPLEPSKGNAPFHNRAKSREMKQNWTHDDAVDAIREFLISQSSYDVFPVSFRLIVLDHMLVVKKALSAISQHGVISAPLWNSTTSMFAGMFTVQDIIHLIQYYYHTTSYEAAAADVDTFRLENIREIEKILKVPPPPLLYVHPMQPLYDACRLLIQSHARRLPLIDRDDQTGKEVVLSVLTQYRVLKFIAVNCRETIHLNKSVRSLGIGTYISDSPPSDSDNNIDMCYPLATATMQTTVFDVVHMFSELGISAVPIVDDRGKVINLYETVDVITLVRLGAYHNLDLTMSQALARRATDFPGIVTCTPDSSLASIFALIRMRRIHRLVVVDDGKTNSEMKGKLLGIISLSDVLKHVIGPDIEIGQGGVGAIPVEALLAAQDLRNQDLASRRGSQEDATTKVLNAVNKMRTPDLSGFELGPSA